jgi:hypothetical protein
MAVIKQKTRKRLSKQLSRLIKKHGPEMTLALVTGIISALESERSTKAAAKAARADKSAKKSKAANRRTKAAKKPAAARKRASA